MTNMSKEYEAKINKERQRRKEAESRIKELEYDLDYLKRQNEDF